MSSHLETIKQIPNISKEDQMMHEVLDFWEFWMSRKDCDIFEITTLYRDYRKQLVVDELEKPPEEIKVESNLA